ncbi:FHA domain-containing protein [Pseudorhodoferax sp.]|uniref:FHA domain-containing protein n=1 Tax=Pseudorhodoferax sp. TaxID=1993553 RepID=UPI002DD65D91|nr:FHA domain-containing protein [Pseudorhodoferax sp.]
MTTPPPGLRRLRRAALHLLAALATLPAWAAPLQISQVADRTPDLAVFLNGSGMPAVPAGGTAPLVTAALGNVALPLKSSAAWDRAQGLSLVVALDVSRSLGQAGMQALRGGVLHVLPKLPPRSQAALLAIGDEVRTVRGFGPAAELGEAALAGLDADAPETALYEGLLTAQELAARAADTLPLRRAVLLLTDGLDDSRKGFGREEALGKAAEADAPVFALVLVPQRMSSKQREDIKVLAQIARASGGNLLQSTAPELNRNLQRLLDEAQQAQLLMLDCKACLRDGVARMLQLGVKYSDVTLQDTRSVRLVAPPPVAVVEPVAPAASAAAPPASHPAPAPMREDGWLQRLLARLAALALWHWLVLGAVVVGVVWVVQRRKEPPPEPPPDAQPSDGPRLDGVVIIAPQPDGGEHRTITLDIDGQGRRQVRVGTAELLLGRAGSSDVATGGDAEASKRHAALYLQRGALMLRDLGSSNGTYLNGTRLVRPEPVHDRDVIRIGRTELRVYLAG